MPDMGNILNDFINAPMSDVLKKDSLYKRRPDVNVIETEDRYTMEMAVPGHNKNDIQISLDDDVLTVKSILSPSDDDNDYRLREFNYKGFERKYELGETIDQNRIDATFSNGILTIVLNKKEQFKPQPARTITIN